MQSWRRGAPDWGGAMNEVLDILVRLQAGQEAMRTDLAAVRADVMAFHADVTAIRSDQVAARGRLDRMGPLVDGIPVVHEAVKVLQAGVQKLHEDVLVLTGIVHRHDITPPLLLEEVRGAHAQIFRLDARVRAIEEQLASRPT